MYAFFIVPVACVHVLYLCQWYTDMFCIVPVLRVCVLYCDMGTPEKSLKSIAFLYLLFYVFPRVTKFKFRDFLPNLMLHIKRHKAEYFP